MYEMARMSLALLLRHVTSTQLDFSAIWDGTTDVFSKNWHLGFTAFGGPPVHFQIVSGHTSNVKLSSFTSTC
jgi:hypothetical protein